MVDFFCRLCLSLYMSHVCGVHHDAMHMGADAEHRWSYDSRAMLHSDGNAFGFRVRGGWPAPPMLPFRSNDVPLPGLWFCYMFLFRGCDFPRAHPTNGLPLPIERWFLLYCILFALYFVLYVIVFYYMLLSLLHLDCIFIALYCTLLNFIRHDCTILHTAVCAICWGP